jgi:hypothetical protein
MPKYHNLYLVLVKMVTILFMHDFTIQTITTFIIYLLLVYFGQPQVSSYRSWLFSRLARLFDMRDFRESNIHPKSDD